MAHLIHGDRRLLARVRRIAGQMAALERSLADGEDCLAVLQQIAAVRGAVTGLMAQVLEAHLRQHVGSEAGPAEREAEMAQVIGVLRSYLR